MNNSIVGYKLFSSVKLPNVNLVKVVMVINLWIFMFVQFFVLIPVSAYAATPNVATDISYANTMKTNVLYTAKVTVTGTGSNLTVSGKSKLSRKVEVPSKIASGTSFDMEIKCGDTVTLTVSGKTKDIVAPVCTVTELNTKDQVDEAKKTAVVDSTKSDEKKTVSTTKDGSGTILDYSITAQNTKKSDGTVEKIDSTVKDDATITEDEIVETKMDAKGAILETNELDISASTIPTVAARAPTGVAPTNGKTTDSSVGVAPVANQTVGKTTDSSVGVAPVATQTDGTKIVQKKVSVSTKTFKSSNNKFKLQFANGVSVDFNGQTVLMKPVTKNKLKPEKYLDGVIYRNVWKDVDVYYELEGSAVKEFIYIRSANANIGEIKFSLSGGEYLTQNVTENKVVISKNFIVVGNKNLELLPYTINTANFGPVVNPAEVISSKFDKTIQSVNFESKWFANLTKDSFPIVIDPTFTEYIPGGDTSSATYKVDNSLGWNTCMPITCDLYVGGTLYSGNTNWFWRSKIQIPYHYSDLKNNNLSSAQLYLEYDTRQGNYQANKDNQYPINVAWTSTACGGFNCIDSRSPVSSATFGASGTIDITSTLKWMVDNNVDGGWLIMWSNESVNNSYKIFQPSKTRLTVSYENPIARTPVNQTDFVADNVGNCNLYAGGGDCGVGKSIAVKASGFNDGYAAGCNPSRVGAQYNEYSSWNSATSPKESWVLGNFGFGCDVTNSFGIWRSNGTYSGSFRSWNDKGSWSMFSGEKPYTIDNSSPVRVGAITPLQAYKADGSISVTIPGYVDDSRDVVMIENDQTKARLDGGGAPLPASGNSPDFNTTYPSNSNFGVINQNWVMEGNGFIRDQADGKCLGVWDPSATIYAAKNCQDASFQKWEYVPETKELKTKYNGQCLTQNGGGLNYAPCNGSASQKWNISRVGDVPNSTGDSNKVKKYQVVAINTKTGQVKNPDIGAPDSNTTKYFGGITDGVWRFEGYAIDRQNGGNTSAKVDLGTVTFDSIRPEGSVTKVESSNPRSAGDARFSPNNPTSVNLADKLIINYTAKETNMANDKLVISRNDGVELKSIYTDRTGQDCTIPCNYSYTWDGRDNSGNFVVDQKIKIDYFVNDRAGATIASVVDAYATVDNHGANIGISNITNGGWTNVQNFPVTGGLAGYNNNQDPANAIEDRDIDFTSAWYCISNVQNCTPSVAITRDAIYNFTIPTNLSVGANYIRIKSEDLAYNKRDAIGNPNQRAAAKPDSQVDNWVVNYDNTKPVVSKPTVTKVINGGTTDVTFTWSSSDTISGFPNVAGVGQSYKLYDMKPGATNPVQGNFVNTWNCTLTNGIATCTVTIKGLLDSSYYLEAIGTDQAQNVSSTKTDVFVTKTKLFFQSNSPYPGTTIADSVANYQGVGERGGNVNININGNVVTFVNDVSSNGTYPTSTNINLIDNTRSKITITCNGQKTDPVQFPLTPNIEYCFFAVFLKNITGTNIVNYVMSKDGASQSVATNFIFDGTKINLSLIPAATYFSPNGDGKFDGMSFSIAASNSDGSNITSIDSYTLVIDYPNAGANYGGMGCMPNSPYCFKIPPIYSYSGTGALPTVLYYNGRDAYGNWLGDYWGGAIKVDLKVTRTVLGVVGETISTAYITPKSNVSPGEMTTITSMPTMLMNYSPCLNGETYNYCAKPGSVQVRGAFNVSGQAPKGWNVDVCVSRVPTAPQNCKTSEVDDMYKLSTVASSTGFYTVITEIPDTTTKNYYIYSLASLPNTATYTPTNYGSMAFTTVDLKKNILGIDMTSSLDGVNSIADLQALLNGSKDINSLRSVVFKLHVSQNTEAVDIDFAQYSNVLNSDFIPGLSDTMYFNHHPGTINETKDPRPNYIPNQKDLLYGSGINSFAEANSATNLAKMTTVQKAELGNKCMQSECVWTYTLPFPPSQSGGNYELKFTSYKGRDMSGNLLSTVDTRGFKVNGQLPMDPKLMGILKGTITTGAGAVSANFVSGIYFTNNVTNTLTVGGESTKTYTVNYLNDAGAIIFTQNTTANSNGFATFTTTFPTGTVDGDYRVQVLGKVIGTIRLDRKVPELTSVSTTDITNYDSQSLPNIFPFVKAGANIKYRYTLNEGTDENYMLSPNGYVAYSTFIEQPGYAFTNNLVLSSAPSGRYAPVIYARDYAGNMVAYGNDYYSILVAQGIVPASVNAKNATVAGINPQAVVYDPSQIGAYNTARDANKDFSVIVDNVNPFKVDMITRGGWMDNDGVLADGISPEVDRLKTISVADCIANKTCSFVIRGNTVTLKVQSERNARGVFEYGLNTVPNQKQIVNPTTTSNCYTISSGETNNGIVAREKDICDLTYTLALNSDGSQNAIGEANNYYQIDFYPVDNSGNIPSPVNNTYKSEIVLVYQDKTASPTLARTLQTNGSEQTDRYIRTNKVTDTSYGERKADVEYQLYKNGVLQSTRVQKMGDTTSVWGNISGTLNYVDCSSGNCKAIAQKDENRTSADFQIGNTASDETANCVQVINGKRTGVCQDGIYEIKARQIDTAGNSSVSNSKIVERDTVAPSAGLMTLNKVGNTLGVTISGESGATGVVTVSSAAGTKTMEYAMNGTSQLIPNVLGYEMQCGGIGYGVSLKIRDAAGNLSQALSLTTNTDTCTVCTAFDVIDKSTGKSIVISESGIWQNPLRGQNYQSIAGSEFGAPRVWNGVTYPHEGLDEQAVTGTPVKSTRSGIVVQSGSNGSKGNYVLIDHLDGFQSQYLHLSERSVVIGQKVDESTVIGKVGMTGNADGPHLHFDIIKNGNYVNPSLYLTKANIKENAVVISENKDFKLVRYGGSAACNVPLSLPPEKATPVTGGSTTPSTAAEDSDDSYVPSLDDILNERTIYEIDPSAYLEQNFNDLMDVINSQTDKMLNNLQPIMATVKCLGLLNPLSAAIFGFSDSVKSCFSLSSLDWDATLKTLQDLLPNFWSGFKDGYMSSVGNTISGVEWMISTIVSTLQMLWGMVKGGAECVKNLVTLSLLGNCDKVGEALTMLKDFVMKIVNGAWDAVQTVWNGIISMPRILGEMIDKVKDLPNMMQGQLKQVGAMIAFTIFGGLTGKVKDISQDVFTTSMFMSGAILADLKLKVNSGTFLNEIIRNVGFVVGIVAELATETAIIAGLTALTAAASAPAALIGIGNTWTNAFVRILKFVNIVADLVLFNGAMVWTVITKMLTLKSWNVAKALFEIGKDVIQVARELLVTIKKIGEKLIIAGIDLLKLVRSGSIASIEAISRFVKNPNDFYYLLKAFKYIEGLGLTYYGDITKERFLHVLVGDIFGGVFRGLHSFSAAVKAYGAENVRKLNVRNMTSWGAYECDLEVYINNVWTKVSGSVKTMWPDSWSEVMIKQAIEEAWSNATYFEGQNTWKGVTKDGKEVLFYNSGKGPNALKGDILNSFPKVK